jgi:Flp pilus assembly protein TadG
MTRRAVRRLPARGDDRGLAALELGIFTSVLLLLAFGALPLYSMLHSYQRMARTSAATLRFATSVPANGFRNAGSGTLTRRPSYDQIAAFARDTANDPAVVVDVSVCKGATCTDLTAATNAAVRAAPIPAASGDTVRLTVKTTVDLSLLGRVANAASRMTGQGAVFPENDKTIAATAAAREE